MSQIDNYIASDPDFARVRALRDDYHMSQRQFVEFVHVPVTVIDELEHGQYDGSLRILCDIAAATGNELLINFFNRACDIFASSFCPALFCFRDGFATSSRRSRS